MGKRIKYQATSSGLMSNKEAAEFLGVSPATLTTWRCTRKVQVPFVKIGAVVKYRRVDLERMIEENLQEY